MIYYRHHILDKNGNKIKNKNDKFIFSILDKSGNILNIKNNKEILEYIDKLVIPPAYNNVSIFYEKNPKILFEGYDDKGRKQQIYSQNHKKKAFRKKFCHLVKFGELLPQILKDIDKNLKSKEFTKNKIIAIILKIVMKCGFRLGNLKYQKLYNSFGISNILVKHIKFKKIKFKKSINSNEYVNKDGINIKFIGKKGVINECDIGNPDIIDTIKKLIQNKNKNDYVFKYNKIDIVDNKKISKNEVIKCIDINNWLKSYDINITSKLFRTFDTNILFIELMQQKEDPERLPINKRKKNIVEVMKLISNQINNTPTIAKKEYLHEDLWSIYLEHPKKYKKLFHDCNAMKCFLNFLHIYCNCKKTIM